MKTIEISATAISGADAGMLFSLLSDSSSYPTWSIWDRCELERPGDPERNGAGEIRLLHTRLSVAREEIIEVCPPTLLAYRLLGGFPVLDYVARTTLRTMADGRTEIEWTASFRPRHRGTGWFWKTFFRLVLKRVTGDLAKAAGRKA